MRIGVDLGGTKIEIVALDDAGAMMLRERVPTPAGDYEATLAAVADLITRTEAKLGRRGSIGIGTPGTISSRTGLMKNSNSMMLNGKALDRHLSSRLDRPIRLENDANCFSLSEAIDGAAAGVECVFGVILGTGVGGGLVINGRPRRGRNGIAGEWGHNPLPWATADEQPAACYCGRLGCIETVLSGAGLSQTYQALAGKAASGETISRLAADGDGPAQETLDTYKDRLSRALAHVINVVDPDIIVLGGGLSNLDAIYDGLDRRVSGFCFSDGVETPIVRHRHGDSSGVRGAAWLWPPTDSGDEP